MDLFYAAASKGIGEYLKLVRALKKHDAVAPSVALYCAAGAGLVDCIEPLLAYGADVNWTDGGPTALSEAASAGHAECVKVLLQKGACLVGAMVFRACSNGHAICKDLGSSPT